MSKSVLLSIKPKYCELIASGKKTVEVRKTKPKLDTPFKCYIYCTKVRELFSYGGGLLGASDQLYRLPTGEIKFGDSIKLMCCNDDYSKDNFLNGKVIGEFVCDCISEWNIDPQSKGYFITSEELTATCLTYEQLHEYGNGKTVYGFHISDLVIYDKPKELREFRKPIDCHRGLQSYNCSGCWDCEIACAPQSWGYVEELS